jgi:hypothetical protein
MKRRTFIAGLGSAVAWPVGIIVRGGLWGRFAAGSKTIEQSRKDSSAAISA